MTNDILKILLVEDNPDDACLILSALKEENDGKYEVLQMNRLQPAVAQLRSEPFGFVFLDLNLPDSNGVQTLITACNAAPEVPVVVLTGMDDMDAAIASLRHGAQDYIVKSDISAPMLKRAINYAIVRKEHTKILTQAQRQLSLLAQERTKEARQIHEHLQEAKHEQIKAAKTITDARHYFETLIQASQDGILTLDASGRFEFCNKAAIALLGWPLEELIGEHFQKVVPPELLPFVLARWNEVRQGEGRPYDAEIIRKNGERRSILVSRRHMTICGEWKDSVIIKDITESKRNADAILRGKREWEQTFDTIPDLVAILDSEYRIVRANRPMAERIGIPVEDLIGEPCYRVVHGTDRPIADCPCAQTLARGTEGQTEVWIGKLNGHYNITTSPTHGDNGRVSGIVHVARDVTKLKETEKQLREMTDELQRRNHELAAFAHTVAHDLKNPAGNAMTAACILMKKDTAHSKENVNHLLDIIGRNSRLCANIVDELLLLAEMRMADVIMRPLNMAQLVMNAQDRMEYMLKQYKGRMVIPEALPTAVGYGPWIEEVWCNYISNALKYGGRPPEVEVGASDAADGMVAFWVRDNGQALAPEDCAKLFKPFSRLDKLRAKGHGLGLSIARNIVERHGGQVGVRIHPERGNVFYFTLPQSYAGNLAGQEVEARPET